jgi:WD40 repeat protein
VGLWGLVLLLGRKVRERTAEAALPPGAAIRRAAKMGLPARPAEVFGPAVSLAGHQGAVSAVGFSPDGRLLVTAGDWTRAWAPSS